MQIKILFQQAVQRFRDADIPEPELEASLLLAHVLKIERATLLLGGDQAVTAAQGNAFEEVMERRLRREPLAYITGEKEFWSLPFQVSRDVLIPRPETEFLVEKILEGIGNASRERDARISILDLGTGSGAIAVVLALELPAAQVTAVDYSHNALKVAVHNANKHKVADRIHFINCDWFAGLAAGASYDVVVSNPPYVPAEILAQPFCSTPDSLQPEVGIYEPRLALDGGVRGLEAIARIGVGLPAALPAGGLFFMEIGAGQAEEVTSLFAGTGAFDIIEVHRDYAGLPRVFQARRK